MTLLFNSVNIILKKNNNQYQCQDCQLRDKTILCSLDPPDLSIINLNKNCMTFKKGQVLFHEDGNATGIYFLTSGKVKISKLGLTGNERIIRLAKEGDILGFRTLFSSAIYPCSATAFEECSACFIPMDIFYKFRTPDLPQSYLPLFYRLFSN